MMEETVFIPDEELLQRIGGEDAEDAFSGIFARYRDRLYHYFVKVTKSEEVAEEAVLDLFMKIWKARASLAAIRNFEAFLFRVAHNLAIDYLRRISRDGMLRRETWEAMEHLAATDTADQQLLSREAEKKINEAVSRLSPQRQEVFRLSREEQLSYDEIAARMQLSRLTVRNHISASLKIIRNHLDSGADLVILISLCIKHY